MSYYYSPGHPRTLLKHEEPTFQFGSQVTDPSIARSLAAFWEREFFKDMDRLNVRRPDTLTRVTEYVPEIAAFVQKVVENGYAYSADGSVYFDTRAFDGKNGHSYAKLQPWSKGNRELLEDGEGKFAISALCSAPSTHYYRRGTFYCDWSPFCCRLCSLEGLKTWRTVMAISMGSGETWLAH